MKDEIFYVGVNSPKEVRKSVLESMKEIIMVTKVYDSVKSRRMEKASKIVNLQNIVKEIDLLFSKLNRVMPKSGVRIKAQTSHTSHTSHNSSKGAHHTNKSFNPNTNSNTINNSYQNNFNSSHINEVNKLSRELEEIESSLSKLG